MLRIAIAGAAGRMGRALTQAVQQNDALVLVAATARAGSSVIGTDAGELAGIGSAGVIVCETLPKDAGQFDLLIDFTTPENTLNNIALCAELGLPAVVGTTGLNSEQIDQLKAYSEKIPLCFAANYSTGVTLCLQLAQQAAQVLAEDSDIEIIEAHHRHKVDAPSGTALALGNAIAESLDRDPKEIFVLAREGITGAREEGTIGFSTIRGGDIVGDHTVLFASEGERVEITHKASSRLSFARGAARAALWISGQPAAGMYDMRDVLGLKKLDLS